MIDPALDGPHKIVEFGKDRAERPSDGGLKHIRAAWPPSMLEQRAHERDRRIVERAIAVKETLNDRLADNSFLPYMREWAGLAQCFAGVDPPVVSVDDSHDNALAETINGLHKAEVIHRRGPWRSFDAVEFAALKWVDWFDNRRLLEPIANMAPAEAEARDYALIEEPPWRRDSNEMASGKPGAALTRSRGSGTRSKRVRNNVSQMLEEPKPSEKLTLPRE